MRTPRTKPRREGEMREREEQQRKAHWELDVHLLFYFYFLGDRAIAKSRKNFYFYLK